MKFFYNIARFLLSFIHVIFPTKVIGVKKFDNKRLVVISPHKTGWDPFVLLVKIRNKFHVCYKAELSKSLTLKIIFKLVKAVPINRGMADLSATKKCIKYLNQDEMILIFPEGTRNTTDQPLLPFKEGAALLAIRSKSNIQPIVMHDKPRLFCTNYLMAGEEIDITPFTEKPLNRETLTELTKLMQDKTLELTQQLKENVAALKAKKNKKIKSKKIV